MYPLKFSPILKSIVWGGQKIAAFKQMPPAGPHIGESWEISAMPGSASIVSNGPLAGRSLTELVRTYKGALLGRRVYALHGDSFPLLVKLIDARDDLSIQVHPDDVLAARRHPGCHGKTEMWYVIDAEPNAHITTGLNRQVTPDELQMLIREKRIHDVLETFDVKPGQFFYLPAGRIHSIGTGCFVAEVQQASDITYRLYDYDRKGLDGKPRPLHIAEALEAIDYGVYDRYRIDRTTRPDNENRLLTCPYFVSTLITAEHPYSKDLSTLDSFVILLCITGSGTIVTDGEHAEPYHQGDTLLLFATTQQMDIRPETSTKMLCIHV